MMLLVVRLAVLAVTVALVVTPFDFGVLFGSGAESYWLRSGIAAGAIGGIFASGAWVEKLVKHKPVEKSESE